MAFLCPSQLTVKKKVLHAGKTPVPSRDSYKENGKTENPISEYKSALKSPSTSTDSSQRTSEQRTVRIKESKTFIHRKIKAASSTKPANIRVKITHNFVSNDEEELNVKKGEYVIILYQQNDWLFVKDSSGKEGFVPYAYCSTSNASIDSKSSTSGYEESFEGSDDIEQGVDSRIHKSRTQNTKTYFPKRSYGPQMTVLYNYKAKYENDVRVIRGESVMLLNDQDPEWLWVATEDGEEGFVPRTFVLSHTCEGCRKKISQKRLSSKRVKNSELNTSDCTATSTATSTGSHQSSVDSTDKSHQIKGTKLIALYDFEGTAFDDLNVLAGEYVYANLKDQIVPHWIWAYSPHRKRSGFIPEDYLKEPVITDI